MKNKGITLIALVLTIIVLLILAGVSIATLRGENGIITKAQEAKELTEKAEIDEQLRLAQLSAKLKKQGGSITIEDLKGELENQGIDYDEEEDGSIVVDGNYVYDFTEEEGEIKYDYQGTVSKPKPKIISIETSYEESSIKAIVTTKRNDKGTLEFYIKEENIGEYEKRDTITQKLENTEYIFQEIDPEKAYTIKVVATATNGETAEKEVNTVNVPKLTEETLVLNYQVEGQKISENDWTKGPITVTVSTKDIDTEKYILETSQNREVWQEAEIASQTLNQAPIQISSRATTRTSAQITQTSTQIFNNKGTLYARLKDKSNEQTGKIYSKEINKIDNETPTVTDAIASTEWSNQNKTITITASDIGGSNIAGYAITETDSLPNNWNNSTENSWTSTDTYKEGTYYAWVKDKAGNVSEGKEVSVTNIENTAPTISVSSSDTVAQTANATITINDAEAGFIANTYIIKYKWTTEETDLTETEWMDAETTTIEVEKGVTSATTSLTKGNETGIYYIHVKGENLKDQANNTSSPVATGKFILDNKGPQVTFGKNGDNNWAKSHSTEITVEDEGTSGVETSSLKYIWSQTSSGLQNTDFNSGTTFESGSSATKDSVSGDDWYLWVIAKDKLGNTSIVKTDAFYLDNTKPTTTEPTESHTTKSITVTLKQTDAHSGIENSSREYAIKEKSEQGWQNWVPDNSDSHTFTGLKSNTFYQVKTRVKDKVGSDYQESTVKELKTDIVPGDISFSYSDSDWTNQNVDVTITVADTVDISKFKLQYKKKTDTDWSESSPNTRIQTVTMTTNGSIDARLTDDTTKGKTGNVGTVVTGNVMKIDKLPPSAPNMSCSSTHNSVTMEASSTDQQANTEYGCSGNIKYNFKILIDSSTKQSGYQTGSFYTFDNLTSDREYAVHVTAMDEAGNQSDLDNLPYPHFYKRTKRVLYLLNRR